MTGIAGNTVTVDDQNGTTMQVSRDIVEKMSSGSHHAKEVPMTMTGLAELMETFSDTVFTVCFHKQPSVESAKETLEKLSLAELKKQAS